MTIQQRLHVAAEAILKRDNMFVYVRPSLDAENIMLPESLLKQETLILHVGHYMVTPIPDLIVTDIGVSGTLDFRSGKFECFVPWECVTQILPEENLGSTSPPQTANMASRSDGTVTDLNAWRRSKGK